MGPFKVWNAVAVPFDEANVSTDYIIPARFLKTRRAKGYGRFLFHDRRFDAEGVKIGGFILNQPPFRTSGILVADENFGCGSAREGAVYALADFGIRCVIAPSFGDIFFNSCFTNGLLPIRLERDACRTLLAALEKTPGTPLTVDLPAQTITGPGGLALAFVVDAMRKRNLLEGLDEVDQTLAASADAIAVFEQVPAGSIPGLVPRVPA
ncbi:MAG: 3-isopropylmalate dehydratase small subunit [Proteobacteria bacterium]|nr:3-isopropylmalate dehydratase small subunit [Pseudomonadota bacterium]